MTVIPTAVSVTSREPKSQTGISERSSKADLEDSKTKNEG